ncbi:head-tail joining protein [Ancylobacter sp. VNQ12]|uniref:head-tail joining protein n=1 Tax=Ancylobacter sp. VNQ12 TaxID=3400920 RepID=UPI003C05AB9B
MVKMLDGGLAKILGKALAPIFFDATLSRDAPSAGPNAWTPGEPTTTSYPCKAIHEEWGASYRSGGLVLAGERKVLILAATLSVTPAPGDRITIRGETFTVATEGAGQPAVSSDPALATWVLRAAT